MPHLVSPQLRSEPRDREAQLLAELVRLSPATLLLAESGSDKSAFLEQGVMPLLASSAAAQSEICVIFDRWTDSPLPALLSEIHRAISARGAQGDGIASTSLAATLAGSQASLGLTLIVILDRFEEHLATRERPGAPEFEDELVEVLTAPELHAHFVIAVDEDAAPLLEPLRARIPRFVDTVIRLPAPSVRGPAQAELGLGGDVSKREPFIGFTPSVDTAATDEHAPALREPAVERDLFGTAEPAIASFRSLRERRSGRVEAGESTAVPAEDFDRSREALSSRKIAALQPTPEATLLTPRHLARAAWAVLGLVVVSAVSAFMLTTWRPNLPAPEGPQDIAASPPSTDIATTVSAGATARPATGVPPAITALASMPAAPAASAPEHRVSRPIVRTEHPRARRATAHPAKAPPVRTGPAPRPITLVNVHVRSEAQRARAEQLIQPLAMRGVRVTGIRVVSAGPRAAHLRFFRAREAGEAARVARVLREVGLPQPSLKRVRGLEKRSTPRQYELWLGPETASRSPQRR